MQKILVIKHGALGDVVLATAPFAAIRRHHARDHITLLTTRPYAELLRGSSYFDEIWVDTRPKLYQLFSFFRLIRRIRQAGFARVYDLQTSERTRWYFRVLRPSPEWVGTAPGASHRHDTPERTRLHTIERHQQQMKIAGIRELPPPSLEWLSSDISRLQVPARYALIIPGGSSHRPGKRWPAQRYAELCGWLVERSVTPLLIGTGAESTVLSTIETLCPAARNLLGQTQFPDIVTLARHAVLAVGNDTGPMHLIAATGCTSLVLFSQESDPSLCAPRGPHVTILREAKLADLALNQVAAWAKRFL